MGVTASIQAAAGGAELALHPYDLGLCANLHEAMGESLASWVLPPCSGTQGGTRYSTVWDERALGLS
ncbi:palmitoyltransferase [Haematococcus lacustris]|uniref:Palmitoyltransferase n=1 Tax=Haematococcus lacustris TaxID=44745 RepID=A0A699Z2D0_HAELA|nr:palmitoyltransferase [Haematococcus lacustris]